MNRTNLATSDNKLCQFIGLRLYGDMVFAGPPSSLDTEFMKLAIGQAKKALDLDEVPVGAVVIQERNPETNEVLSKPLVIALGYNTRESRQNPLGHAEIMAIQGASEKLGRWRLSGCALYVTLEPCVMCSGAAVLARVDRVIYGATDKKAGAVESLYQVLSDLRLNHRPQVTKGVLEAECSQMLSGFFSEKRRSKNSPAKSSG